MKDCMICGRHLPSDDVKDGMCGPCEFRLSSRPRIATRVQTHTASDFTAHDASEERYTERQGIEALESSEVLYSGIDCDATNGVDDRHESDI